MSNEKKKSSTKLKTLLWGYMMTLILVGLTILLLMFINQIHACAPSYFD